MYVCILRDSEFFNRTLSRKRRSRNTSLVDSSSSSSRRIRSIIHDYRPHITEKPSGDFVACPAARKAEEHAQVLSIAQFLCLLDTSGSSPGTLFERTTRRYRALTLTFSRWEKYIRKRMTHVRAYL